MPALMPWMSPILTAWAVTPGVLAAGWLNAGRNALPGEAAAEEGVPFGRGQLASGPVDLAASVGTCLALLRADLRAHGARVRVGIEPGLLAEAAAAALRHALLGMLRAAMGQAPLAGILVTARRQGKRLALSIIADTAVADEERLRAALREAETIAAMHGGSLDVELLPAATCLRLRLPEHVPAAARKAAAPRRAADPIPPAAAGVAASVAPAAATATAEAVSA